MRIPIINTSFSVTLRKWVLISVLLPLRSHLLVVVDVYVYYTSCLLGQHRLGWVFVAKVTTEINKDTTVHNKTVAII